MGKSGFSIRAKMLDTHLRASFTAYLFGFRTLTQGTYIKVIPESSGWKFERSFRGLKLSFVGLRPSLIAKWWEVCPLNFHLTLTFPQLRYKDVGAWVRGNVGNPFEKDVAYIFPVPPLCRHVQQFWYEWRTKILAWGHQKWVVPFRLWRFCGLQHQHRSRTIQYTLWHHEICTCSGKCRNGFAPCSSSILLL